MRLRTFQETTRLEKPGSLQLLIQALIVVFACVVTTQAQRPGLSQPARDMVRAIERKEMERMLLLKPILAPKDDPARRAVLKQIGEDFKELQGLNNKMMADAWARPELDYHYISGMVSQIRSKATRLKSNLALPEAQDNQPAQDSAFSDPAKFRAGLLHLDRLIMSFATNPLFQKSKVVEVDLAKKASSDLEGVIEMSGKLKKIAAGLSKSARTSP